jgi:hypothetical protein
MMNVSLEDAYAEACKALGEAIVRERLLLAEITRLTLPSDSAPTMPDEVVE